MTGLYIIKNNYAERPDIDSSDKWKDAFDFEDKNLCNLLNTLKVKHLASYLFCSGDLY